MPASFPAGGSDRPLAFEEGIDGAAQLFVRPHDLQLARDGEGLPARVRHVCRLAGRATLELALQAQARAIEIDLPDEADGLPAPGAQIAIKPTRYRVFAAA